MNVTPQVSAGEKRVGWAPFAAIAGMLAMLFAAVAIPYSKRYHLRFEAAAGIYGCFLLLLWLALLPGVRPGQALLSQIRPRWRNALWFFSFCVPYLLYALSTGDFRWAAFLRVLSVALTPTLLYLAFPSRHPDRFNLADLGVAVFLITVVLDGWMRNVWRLPVNLDFMGRLLLIASVATTWSSVRPVPGLHFHLEFTRKVLRAAGLNFLYFGGIAIPVGFLIRFTDWHPRWHGLGPFALDYVEIFLFIALLEELFFRGFLQSLFTETIGSALKAQAVVALVFGMFHILHAPFPNWRYVALASIAGWFYGQVYRQGGGVFASALTHAMVDTVWRTWFTRA